MVFRGTISSQPLGESSRSRMVPRLRAQAECDDHQTSKLRGCQISFPRLASHAQSGSDVGRGLRRIPSALSRNESLEGGARMGSGVVADTRLQSSSFAGFTVLGHLLACTVLYSTVFHSMK